MNETDTTITYGEFVTRVIGVVSPAFPVGLSLLPAFTATEIKGVVPSADSATLRAAKAESFVQVGSRVCAQMGLNKSAYVTYPSLANGTALIDHSCYTRNLRRWISGTLPRKHKSRADFAILAACWSYAWLDQTANPDLYSKIQEDVENLVCLVVPDVKIEATPESLAVALWTAGQQAFQHKQTSDA